MARKYDHEYKVQAVKLAKEIGGAKAAKELGIPEGTIHTWLKAVRAGKLDIGEGSHTPTSAMSLSEEITMLRKRVKEQDKEIRRLKDSTAECLGSAAKASINISQTKTAPGSTRILQMP